MNGIIIVDKPQGWTSFDVVAKIRNLSGEKKVGHSGTLDPLATGVLPIFFGTATKLTSAFLTGDKGYTGEMVFGAKTDTGDADGKILTPSLRVSPSPSLMERGIKGVRIEELREVFKKYTGEIEQVPPMYSAVKVDGQRLYKLARQGVEVKRQPRKIHIYELRLTSDIIETPAGPTISFSVHCSKGTYIRQLAVDIGDDLGCGAYLASLRRVYAHPFHIAQALELETIVTLAKIGKLASVLINPADVLPAKVGAGSE